MNSVDGKLAFFVFNECGGSEVDLRFRLLTILRTINTKPHKDRDGAVLAKVKSGVLLASAMLFLIIGSFSFTRFQDTEALLYMGLALWCAAGGFLQRHLFRRGILALFFCIVLELGAVCMTVWGFDGVTMCIWALFFPIISISVCGIKPGGLLSGLLALYFVALFYTPLQNLIPAQYPAELGRFYPLLYGAAYVIVCACAYLLHKQTLTRHDSEAALERAVHTEYDHLMIMMTQTILSISNAVDARDPYTQRHSARVAEYSLQLAKTLDWDAQRLDQLYNIALLHDIGKIGISDSILNKHAALTSDEREIIKQHTVIGGEILKDLTLLSNASIGAVSHHERFDGTGYPYGLKGKQIPLEARIIGIADAFDAMNSSRVYRARIAPKRIMQELRDGRGTQFDPELLDRFLPIAEKVLQEDEI